MRQNWISQTQFGPSELKTLLRPFFKAVIKLGKQMAESPGESSQLFISSSLMHVWYIADRVKVKRLFKDSIKTK